MQKIPLQLAAIGALQDVWGPGAPAPAAGPAPAPAAGPAPAPALIQGCYFHFSQALWRKVKEVIRTCVFFKGTVSQDFCVCFIHQIAP